MYSRTIEFSNNSVLCRTRYRFRPKQSTVHAILNIVSTCFDNVEYKKFTGLLLLDLTKAFETVQHKILLAILHHYGIRDVVNNFFESFLANQSQTGIIDDNHSSKSNIDKGVPQGSSLRQLLFFLKINDLPNCIRSTTRLFVHDTSILVKVNTSNELEYCLHSELAKGNSWIVDNKLPVTLNAAKSNAIILQLKLQSPPADMNLNRLNCAARSK